MRLRRPKREEWLLESAVRSNCTNKLWRAIRTITRARPLKSVRTDAAFAL